MGTSTLQALILCLLITTALAQTFTVSLSSTLTLVSGVAYTLNATFPTRSITAGAYALVTTSNNFNLNTSSITNPTFATTLSSSYSSTTYTLFTNSSGHFITFASIYPSALTSETLLSLKINMPNPWGVGTELISLTIFDSGGNALVTRQTFAPSYTASPLNNCQWTSNSSINGDPSIRTLSFVPSVPLITSAFIQVSIPVWFSSTSTSLLGIVSCSAISNIDFAPTCNNTVTNGNTEVYATTGTIFASNKTVSSAVSMSIRTLRNPWSMRPSTPILIELYGSATRVTQSCTTLTQTNTAMNTFSSFSPSGTFTTISGVSASRTIIVGFRNPFPSNGGQMRVSVTNGASVSYAVQGGVVVVSQNGTQVIIRNISTSDLSPGISRPLSGWTFTNPPSTRQFTITLTSVFVTDGITYGIDSTSNSYSCLPGNISVYSLTPNTFAINAMTTYSITFTTVYPLTSGSYIGITFPQHISVGAGCSSTNGLLSCSVSNTSYGNISISGAVPLGTSLTIRFTAVTNPSQEFRSNPFIIYTYYDSGLDSIVDRLLSGMTFTGIANTIPASNVVITPSSLFTYTTSNYIFSVTLVDRIVADGVVSITFPSTITLGSVGLVSATFPTTTCSLVISDKTVNITGCFSADYATLSMTITLSGIINPPSLEPTSSFAIRTYGPLGIINVVTSGLTVTMTSASTSTAFTITPQVFTVHATSTYSLSFSFFTPHSVNDYILLNIPASMQISASPSCAPTSGIGVVGCSVFNSTTARMVMSLTPSATIAFTFSSLRNYDISSTPISFQCYVYSSTGYLMEITPTSSASYTADTITTFSVASNNQIVLNSASNITITLSAPFGISSTFTAALTSLLFIIPAEFTLIANSSCTSTVGTSCSLISSTSFQVVAPGVSLVSISVTFLNILLPSLSGSSSSFSIQYLYNSKQIATVNTGVVVNPYCSSPCQQCTTSPIICASCLPAPNLLILLYPPTSSCVSSCPPGYFTNGTFCSACIAPCANCTTATLCLTCNNSTIYYALNSSCISGCPTGYYNSSGNCTLCVAPCLTCTTATSCLSCLTNFLYNNSCVNASACPAGTYGNTTTNACESCQTPCTTCSGSMGNCTSCNGSNALYNNTCLGICPATFYANNFVCVPCVAPCLACSTLNLCLSCVSSYLFNGTCYNASACPPKTFANLTAFTCDACIVNCSTCELVASNCTSCASPYFNYNGSCVNTCPSGLFQNVTVCSACVLPCATCNSASSCLSCATSYYTNNSCVNASLCPVGTFANLTALNCDPCAVNCSACSLFPTNCTACASPFFNYNGTCVNVCPSGLFQNVSVCSSCVPPCATCTSASLCLSCATNYYTNNSCVTADLCPVGTFANLTALNCEPCTSNCSSCSLIPTNCTACASPFFNYNGTCVNVCPSGFYKNINVCSPCVSPCATCTTQTLCLSCSVGYLTNNTCVNASLCPSGTFANLTALTCDVCTSNCTTCSSLPSNCTSCISPLLNFNGTCTSACPPGMFPNGTICISCLAPCLLCTSASICTSCSNSYLYNSTCLNASQCPPGTFANLTAFTCDSCSSNCSTCTNLPSNCTTCTSPYYYINGTCQTSCPGGMFKNGTICSNCSLPCATCTAGTTCLSCASNYYTNFTCVSAASCPPGTFANLTALNCDACIVNCSTCSMVANNCTSCASPYFNYNGTCINTCPSGLFQNVTICSACVLPCATCTTQTICLSCSVGYYTNNSCVNASLCPAGTFANLTALNCDICTSNCTTCSSIPSNCTACTAPWVFYNQQCISSCPNSTYKSGTLCLPCESPCNFCLTNTTCITCLSNFYFSNQTCLTSSLCPNGTYADNPNLNCSSCTSPCLTCSVAPNNCTACIPPKVYNNNYQCLSSCPITMYNSSSICAACVPPCGNCTSATSCLSCLGGFFLTGTSCVSSTSCPNGTYAQSVNNTCNPCPFPCTSCSTPTICFTCFVSYYYYNFGCTLTCPNITFPNNTLCSPCSPSCLTCMLAHSTCTSCQPSLNFFNNTCMLGCPPGTYNASGACAACSSLCNTCSNFSVCTGCTGPLFLTNSQCLTSCPPGTFANTASNTCNGCTQNCATCQGSGSNCSTCTGNFLYHSFSCSLNCPTNFFNVSGVCTTCPNCNSCTNATNCFICATGYYLYQGGCYSTCPSVAPYGDNTTFTCSLCGTSCSSCSSDGSYCFSCSGGYLILDGKCYVSCPSGYTPSTNGAKCNPVKPVSSVYYPFTISLACISLVFLFSKLKYAHSQLIGNTTAFLAIGFLLSTAAITIPTYTSNNSSGQGRLLQTEISNTGLIFILGVGIAVISVLFLSGVCFVIVVMVKFDKDPGVNLWKKNAKVNKFMFWFFSILSCFHFAIFRFIYSKLFLRECFSCYFKGHKRLIFITNVFTFIVILLTNVPAIALSLYILLKQEGNSQLQIFAIDNLVVSTALGILLLLDMGNRNPEDFQSMLEDFPYLKKTKKYQDMDSSSGSLMSIHYSEQEPHYKTEADSETLGKLGRINAKEKLGNFGVIDQLQETIDNNKVITKTLPEFNKLKGDTNFDPYQLKRINDDLFFQQKEYTKKFNQIKQEYTKGILDQEILDDDGATHHNEDMFRESVNVQELINQRKKQVDPQEYLNRFKSEDYDDLNQEQMALLMQMAEQKGLDPKFIKQTFGKNKYYNKKILQEIMGDHEQVNKQSLQQLLNDANSQTKLRQVLGKKSNINTDKLIDILNHQHYRPIIEAMFNKETGFLSAQAIKELLSDNSKYSRDFITNLLNNQIIDRQRLKQLIQNNKQGELETLKTVKSLGGDSLQRQERLSNMLGKDSPLNPTLIPKIKKEMSEQSISNVFDKKSPANTTMIRRVINNKRINLSELNPISEMPEIIEEFAELLTCGNEDMQENILELLENNDVDGQKLKELIQNSGNSQDQMAKLLDYIKENKERARARQQTPADEQQWTQNQQEDDQQDGEQSSLPSLNFSINHGEPQGQEQNQRKKMVITDMKSSLSNFEEESLFGQRRRRNRTRFKKKQTAPIHLPSEEIYLQRIQAPHEVLRGKKFRKSKKKTTKQPNKFMDEDNEVYDFDF